MKLNKKILAIVSALGIAGAVYSTTVSALPDQGRTVMYFTDATMTVQVGESGNGCQHSYSWGEQTPYYTIETFQCF